MRLSIVTISYNQSRFLEKTILSVIEQSYKDIDYIIVDPGSTDSSREIIKKYSPFFSHIVFEPDSGPAEGLNKGFSKASGDIYGYLNSDDTLLPDAIDKVVTYFKSNNKVDVVSGNCFIVDGRDKILRKSYSDRFSLFMYAYSQATLMQPSTFFKKDCFNKTNGFNIKNQCCWDDELFVEMSINGAIFRNIDHFLSCFRLHNNSITSTMRLDDKILEYNNYKFKRIINRDKVYRDIYITFLLKLLKHVKNPNNFIERLLKGKIYGRETQ